MATVTLNISGDSQEVISVIRSLAKQQEIGPAPVALETPEVANDATMDTVTAAPRAHTWSAVTARDTRNNVSADAQRLLDALVRAPDHQMHIDEIYSQLELDRYGLIGARRSISAALRRNAATANATLLATKDRRVTLNSEYADAISVG
ncbi:MAG: hypothetical protein OXL37_05510 [Chloroflexota bacterium]|nr:hypothetical protein [Chloroflexota bacterium]MDE2961040.1 hypothetical protein [Chloroflexota bacterium]